jgi:hypothetical protein
MTCPECGAQAEQLAFCDGCSALCCYDCLLNVGVDCERPTDEWIVCHTVSKSISGKPLNPPRVVRTRTHIAPGGHMWRPVSGGF